MESTAEITLFCTGCRITKSVNEFIGFGAKGISKQFRTCNNCRNRTAANHKNTKKRHTDTEINEEMEQENEESLEIIEPDSFYDYIAQFFPSPLENNTENTENIPSFHFKCEVDISSFDKSAKEIADELAELIEDVDEFRWMYVFHNFFIDIDILITVKYF